MTEDMPTKSLPFELPLELAQQRYFRCLLDLATPGNLNTAEVLDKSTFPQPGILSTAMSVGPQVRHPAFDPVGHCIYCGAREYAPNEQRPLGEEHIIAEGMGGSLVLPEASCRTCEGITSAIEGSVLRQLLLAPRRRLRLRGKKRKRPDADVTLTTVVDGVDIVIKTPLDEHPTLLFLPTFTEPGLLAGRSIGYPGFAGYWADQLVPNLEMGHGQFTTPYIDLVRFCQMLAKIGHSYAVAMLGEDLFVPMLADFIRRKFSKDEIYPECYHLIGGQSEGFAPSKGLHQVGLVVGENQDGHYVLTAIRLFGNLGAPIYLALIGKLNPGIAPEQVHARAVARSEALERKLGKITSGRQ